MNIEGLWDRAYGLSSLCEKTTESNQMSLQKQHFLLSYLKTLIVGPTGILNPQPPTQELDAQPTEPTSWHFQSISKFQHSSLQLIKKELCNFMNKLVLEIKKQRFIKFFLYLLCRWKQQTMTQKKYLEQLPIQLLKLLAVPLAISHFQLTEILANSGQTKKSSMCSLLYNLVYQVNKCSAF